MKKGLRHLFLSQTLLSYIGISSCQRYFRKNDMSCLFQIYVKFMKFLLYASVLVGILLRVHLYYVLQLNILILQI